MLHIEALAHREPALATRIQAVIALAHAQEAQLLLIADVPPSAKTAFEIAADGDCYLGALLNGELVGVLSFGPDEEPQQLCISTLAVHPGAQRQGAGRRLVLGALARAPGATFSVAATAGNAPALALYQALGFMPYRRGVIGPQQLPLLKLRRTA